MLKQLEVITVYLFVV